jgi:signal transduction histidine kinase
MLGIRDKIALGFGGLLIIIAIIGGESVILLGNLGEGIDVVLRQNYVSVVACHQMKEAINHIQLGVLLELFGYRWDEPEGIARHERQFIKALKEEQDSIDVPGEEEKVRQIEELFRKYARTLLQVRDPTVPLATRKHTYFGEVLPLSQEIYKTADDIIELNHTAMNVANRRAMSKAITARTRMLVFVCIASFVALGFTYFVGRWILNPINRLISSADDIKKGNLDLFLKVRSGDEIGRLLNAFNLMAASLREYRRVDQASMARVKGSTEQAFRSLPDALAVADPEGRLDIVTESARKVFQLEPGIFVQSLPYEWFTHLFMDAISTGRSAELNAEDKLVQRFVSGQERYYRPKAVPMLDSENEPTGVLFILEDVTVQRQQQEMKRSVIATVSHQLRTPLTSIQMVVHMLLQEKAGMLTEKQAELLVTAREEAQRLHNILIDLLDISSIESGKAQMNLQVIPPHLIVFEAVQRFSGDAQDRKIDLVVDLPEDLPNVWVDTTRMGYVFSNLLSNALKYTPEGGHIVISARPDEGWVNFSIADTGTGIPHEHLHRVFDRFFRAPSQERNTGAGLGLSIVKEIVEAHGGSISAASEGVGSVFTFSLKVAEIVAEEETGMV